MTKIEIVSAVAGRLRLRTSDKDNVGAIFPPMVAEIKHYQGVKAEMLNVDTKLYIKSYTYVFDA
ncbi:MAG TPA: hypothetical protein IGS52_06195 [Oscillatoriaceae cyanobacterium M33_DOE_052]|uniref:Uncharacterized protein n=1 Tax=Planktothricoides sp. SpSt-374 TaxID=2282167 RepID=A0A7C3ZKK2_9CYAN|nr:hypothetical protein [Oscillatoriaceae cyanobacterium M33_DOE_052]